VRYIERTGDDFIAEHAQLCRMCHQQLHDQLTTPTSAGYIHAAHWPLIVQLQSLQARQANGPSVVQAGWFTTEHMTVMGTQTECIAFIKQHPDEVIVTTFTPTSPNTHRYRFGVAHDPSAVRDASTIVDLGARRVETG